MSWVNSKLGLVVANIVLMTNLPSAEVLDGRQDSLGPTEQIEVTLNSETQSYTARIDTGAATSSIQATEIQVDGDTVTFYLWSDDGSTKRQHKADVSRFATIKTSEGIERRPIVEFDIRIAGELYENVEASLNDRTHLRHFFLVGRNLLTRGEFGVNVRRDGPVPPFRPLESSSFKYCILVCYDYQQGDQGTRIVDDAGVLHEGIISPLTIRLGDSQVDVLIHNFAVVQTERPEAGDAELEEIETSDCHEPHHAFVFLDGDWEVVGWLEICFQCDSFRSNNIVGQPNLGTLRPIMEDWEMPIYNDSAEYRDLYERFFRASR